MSNTMRNTSGPLRRQASRRWAGSLGLLVLGAVLALPAGAVPTASTTVLALSGASVPVGTAVTLTATVQAQTAPVTPGLVTFTGSSALLVNPEWHLCVQQDAGFFRLRAVAAPAAGRACRARTFAV